MREANRARCSGEGGGGKGTWRPRSQTSFRIPSFVSCSNVLVKRWLPSSKMAGSENLSFRSGA